MGRVQQDLLQQFPLLPVSIYLYKYIYIIYIYIIYIYLGISGLRSRKSLSELSLLFIHLSLPESVCSPLRNHQTL